MRHLLVLTSILALTSCGTNRYFTSSTTTSAEINNVDYFQPLSYIQYIEKGNKASLSDSLSGITCNNLISVLNKNKTALRLSKEIIINNDTLKRRMEIELAYLTESIANRKRRKEIPLTPGIDSILKKHNQRFALATVATGFGRRRGNYGGQLAKGAAIGILTLGMAVPIPVKSSLTLYAFIFDSQKGEITYYKKSFPVEKDPTDERILEKQFIKLFDGYLYGKN